MNKEQKTVAIFAVVFVALAGMAYYFVSKTRDEVEAMKVANAQLQKDIDGLQKEADQEEALIAELESLKVNFAQYVKILPSPQVATEEKLMETMQEKCERTQFALDNYAVKQPRRRPTGGKGRRGKAPAFREIDVTLQAGGTYEQFVRFLNSLERHESFLRVNSFQCRAPNKAEIDEEGKETWPLKVKLNVSTFRYESGS